MLRIPEKIRDEIIVHALEGLPLEVCGILGGIHGAVAAVYRITNTDASPEHFLMDPREQAEVFAELERSGLEIAAFYHSHPSGPECPSAEDVRMSFYPDIPTLIVSLADQKAPVMNAFKIRGESVEQVDLKIIRT